MAGQSVNYVGFLNELTNLINQRSSGALIGLTAEHFYVYVYLIKGRIVAVKYKQEAGVSAIRNIKRISEVRLSFRANVVAGKVDSMPKTDNIMNFLKQGVARTRDLDNKPEANSKTIAHKAKAYCSSEIIKTAFISVTGPIGDLIFDQVYLNSVSKQELIKKLLVHLELEDVKTFQSLLKKL